MKIVETVSGSVTSTKQFIGGEERDGSGTVMKQFFTRGVRVGSTNYFFGKDHLGSIRTMSDNSGVVQASYSFDPYGRTTKIEGSVDSDFGFDGMYVHARSGLDLATFRAYSPALAQWLSRDPLGEQGGANQYSYALSDPINLSDPSGLAPPGTWALPEITRILRDVKKAQDLDSKVPHREHGGTMWVNPKAKCVSVRPLLYVLAQRMSI